MYTTKITNVETVFYQASNSYFVDVEVEIYKEVPAEQEGEKPTVVLHDTRKFGYPVGTKKEEILADLDKLCATLASDEEVGKRSAELEAHLAEAESLKNDLLAPAGEKEVE